MTMVETLYNRINDYSGGEDPPRVARGHPFLVLRRGQEAGDDQLPHLPVEKDGLFCERIFGPERDWECACGKYKGIKHKASSATGAA